MTSILNASDIEELQIFELNREDKDFNNDDGQVSADNNDDIKSFSLRDGTAWTNTSSQNHTSIKLNIKIPGLTRKTIGETILEILKIILSCDILYIL